MWNRPVLNDILKEHLLCCTLISLMIAKINSPRKNTAMQKIPFKLLQVPTPFHFWKTEKVEKPGLGCILYFLISLKKIKEKESHAVKLVNLSGKKVTHLAPQNIKSIKNLVQLKILSNQKFCQKQEFQNESNTWFLCFNEVLRDS